MITMLEAKERVNARLAPLKDENGVWVAQLTAAGLSASGTDVNGQELTRELAETIEQFAELVRSGADAVEVFNGMVLREFWLGYEHGRAHGDD